MKKVHLNLSIDETAVRWLKMKAAEEGKTVSEVVELLVKQAQAGDTEQDMRQEPKYCILCGRKFEGYGAKCPDCREEISEEERQRILQIIRETIDWLDKKAPPRRRGA